jgi:hypothetical protein
MNQDGNHRRVVDGPPYKPEMTVPIDALFPPIVRRSQSVVLLPWDHTTFIRWACATAAAVLAAVVALSLGISGAVWHRVWPTVLLVGVCALVSVACAVRAWVAKTEGQRKAYEEHRPEEARERGDQEHLATLIAVNRNDMSAYQELTQRQAITSYRWSLAAAGAGLTVLIAGVVLVVGLHGTADKAAVAGLAAITGALASYVARTYLRIYERTLEQLNFYFEQPLVTSYLLTAERLTEKISSTSQKDEFLGAIIARALDAAARPANVPEPLESNRAVRDGLGELASAD